MRATSNRRTPALACLSLLSACLAVAACLAVLLGGCASSSSGGSSWQPPYYEASGFSQDNGRIAYTQDGATASKTGVDVSEHQGYIDWGSVAADGIGFAIVRVGYRGTTEGAIAADAYAAYNLDAAQQAGLDCGVYFFSQAVTVEEAREEAAFVLDFLGGRDLEYPVAFDYEREPAGVAQPRTQGISDEEAAAITAAFCEAIEAGGYDAMIYGNAYDLDALSAEELATYPLWYAEYAGYPGSRVQLRLWQYASDGQVAGIDAAVDLSLDLDAANG